MEDIEVIHEQKSVGRIYGSILLKYSNLIKLTIINAPKMDNNIITKIDTDDIFNDVYKKEPYFYNDELEIDWEIVLSIINGQDFIILNSKLLNNSDYFYKKLNDVKIVAILANYYQMEKLHNILVTLIKKYYNSNQFLNFKKKYITKEIYEYILYNCNKDIIGDIIEFCPKYVTKETYEYYFKLIKDEYMLAVITNDNEKLYNEKRLNYFMTDKCEMMTDIIKKGYANSEFNMYEIEMVFSYTYTYYNKEMSFKEKADFIECNLIISPLHNKYLYIDELTHKLCFNIVPYKRDYDIGFKFYTKDFTDILCNIKEPNNIEIKEYSEY